MKVKLSDISIENLRGCNRNLITLFTMATEDSPIDFSIICGYRNKEDQEDAFKGGFSNLHFPYSRHNEFPSMAVDVVPYPVDWSDLDKFKLLGKHILSVAKRLGIKVKWPIKLNNGTVDYPHYELKK
ncbi:MAG: hypothetical protein ACTSRT_03205 [Promethearchaeota archaeon]